MNYESFLSDNARAMRPSIIRRMSQLLAGRSDVISFAGGMPNLEMFPTDDLQAIFSALLAKEGPRIFQYSVTSGLPGLIEALVEHLHNVKQIKAAREEIIIVSGSQQGLDLVARILLNPGDVVLVESPSYIGATAAFNNVRADIVGVRRTSRALDLDDLMAKIDMAQRARKPVRFLYLTPNFQNPTGFLLSQDNRRQILDLAERFNFLIFEDDPYGDIYFSGGSPQAIRPIKSMDTGGRVIYLNSFSKILVPGLRVAWITAPKEIIYQIQLAKQAADICTSTLSQTLICEYCRRGRLGAQMDAVRKFYEKKCQVMLDALATHMAGGARWQAPLGGYFVWLTLNQAIDTEAVAPSVIDEAKVAYIPGGPFHIDGHGKNTIRLSFSNETDATIREGISRLSGKLA
ncbi:MAG: PLP-dependent aminotransferase family protein [Acidobacteria bacterium]|nr:PLP-dependent aminotransferase family protein [Acidobacteriota bacterium]MBI3655244.1 PLP-dependent aminotransferase family protein [Acidobacteriota bacterium]